jgi:hypothetical protein
MAEIVNLRQVRKDRARAEKRAAADENAARFGRTRALKLLEMVRNARAETELDGHLRESGVE